MGLPFLSQRRADYLQKMGKNDFFFLALMPCVEQLALTVIGFIDIDYMSINNFFSFTAHTASLYNRFFLFYFFCSCTTVKSLVDRSL